MEFKNPALTEGPSKRETHDRVVQLPLLVVERAGGLGGRTYQEEMLGMVYLRVYCDRLFIRRRIHQCLAEASKVRVCHARGW